MRSLCVLRHPPAVALLTVLALAGCGGTDEPSAAGGGGDATVQPAPSTTGPVPDDAGPPADELAEETTTEPTTAPTAVSSSSPAASEAPEQAPFEANTRPDTEDPVGNGLTVTDVEVGRHPGYDRVVFTLDGDGEGEPGWRVEYTDAPTRQGSGDPFTPAGDAFLSVLIRGVGYPFDTGIEEYSSIPGGSAEVVREVQLQGVYEGQYDGAVGLTGERPFRVFRLEDPPRVVIDVAHGS
jgi:hypothetical protein